jgi:hypothetical protein
MPYVWKKKRKKISKKTIMLYVGLTFLCSIVGAGIAFITTRAPTLADQAVQNMIISEAEKHLNRELDSEDISKIKDIIGEGKITDVLKRNDQGTRNKANAGSTDMEQYKELIKQELDPETIEKLKEQYKK